MPSVSGSLHRRLIVRLAAVLGVVVCLILVLIGSDARQAADDAYDQVLLASALSIGDGIRADPHRLSVDLPHAALGILAMADRDRAFYKVLDDEQNVIVGYADLPGERRSNEKPLFSDASYRGVPIRMVSLGRMVVHQRGITWVTTVVAQTREERDRLSHDFLFNAAMPILFVVLVSVGLIWVGVRQALAPLAFLERLINARQPNDFSPIDAAAPAEVGQLLAAINTLLSRLKLTLDSSKMFLADMTHQIRTPLAAARSQTELALEETDPEALRQTIVRIHRNAVHASELITQLLNHAMVIHRRETLQPSEFDLIALTRQVVQRAETLDDRGRLRFTSDSAENVVIVGDPVIMREALTNLVDNALKYGGTEGYIDITVLPAGPDRGPVLEIADCGPGIPVSERSTVLARFSRGTTSSAKAGSGLGLAIVAAVADAHHARLLLLEREGGGLRVLLEFPVPAKPRDTTTESLPFARQTFGLLLLAATILPGQEALGGEHLFFPGTDPQAASLTIASATDTRLMQTLIRKFQAHHPMISVDYEEVTTRELYELITRHGQRSPDLVISSAEDLMAKLVNDGHVRPHRSLVTAGLPREIAWRNEAFRFTQEPVVIVYNRELLPDADVPTTRDEFIALLTRRASAFSDRVATYDVAESGIGYLLATQDSVLNSQFWQLVDAMADRDVRQYCCTEQMLEAISRGEMLIGYNLLGSYARAMQLKGAPIGIVMPSDYTLMTSRIVSIPKRAPFPHLAGFFIDYLLSETGQHDIANETSFFAVSPTAEGPFSASHLTDELSGPLQRVRFGPGLLVFLDETKRARFIEQWKMITQRP